MIGDDPETDRDFLECPLIRDESDLLSLNETDLPHVIRDADQNTIARFGIWHDAESIHLILRVWNDSP